MKINHKRGYPLWMPLILPLFAANALFAQHGEYNHQPPRVNLQLIFSYQLNTATGTIREVINIEKQAQDGALNQTIVLGEGKGEIKLLRYLARASREQTMIADDTKQAQPALLLSIDGPTQSMQRWMIASHPQRNRLNSLIGKWRYFAIDDPSKRNEQLAQFENEYDRSASLLITPTVGELCLECHEEVTED